MSFKSCNFETQCLKWTVQLPHPESTIKSPKFTLDGYQWYMELKGQLKQISSKPDRYVEGWEINLVPCVKRTEVSTVLYVAKALVYERAAYALEFDRRFLGKNDDTVSMLLMITPKTLCASKEISRPLDSEDASAQTLSFESFSKDMIKLLDGKENSDVTLKCGDSSFPAHKNVLATRSDVFATMFRQDMRESKTGVVDIVDLDSSVLEQFVRYLYSGKVEEMSMNMAFDLYQVAEKYAVHSLKLFCASYMRENLSQEVVCKVLLLAGQVGDSKLLEAAECFAANSETFLKTEEWRDFAVKHTDISTKIFLKYVNKLQ